MNFLQLVRICLPKLQPSFCWLLVVLAYDEGLETLSCLVWRELVVVSNEGKPL